MRKDTYENKLSDTLDSNQFSKSKGTNDAIVLKIERDINKELLAMRKKDEISESLYTRMRSTGGQPARIYGLAKVHKVNTPLRPVLSLPGSSYYYLNKVLAKFFEKIEGANIETNSLDAREILESTNLEPNENLISLDVKSLYTNVPLEEAIDIALRKLYEQDEPPSIARKTIKRLLNMAVSQVHFKCNETWYVQKDGLAMGTSLAVILANLWMQQYKTALSRDISEMFLPEKDLHEICPECNKKVTYRSKGVECECCLNWYHVKCGDISDDEYRNISETVWYCRKCIAIREKNKSGQQSKLFFRYVDDIVRTVKGDPEKVLRAANFLYPNLQYTVETPNTKGTLAFLDLQISIDKSRKISCGRYQKPTDTGTILNFRTCAPLQYKRSVNEGTVHRVFRSTSTWEEYDKAMKINRKQWFANQYPESWSSRVASHALEKIISKGKNKKNMAEKKKPCDYSSDSPPILMVQYRWNHSQTLAKKVRDITNALIIFTTRKLKTCMPSLKSSFSSELKSKVVYRLECCGCKSIYVGQTVRHLTTRIEEHRKEDTPVGQHIRQCGSERGKSECNWKTFDQPSSSIKLFTLEALHIRKERPAINPRDEFRSRELTLRL